jgi:hypothetical protein
MKNRQGVIQNITPQDNNRFSEIGEAQKLLQ